MDVDIISLVQGRVSEKSIEYETKNLGHLLGHVAKGSGSVDETNRSINFVISTDKVDRDGEVIEVKAVAKAVKAFGKNPVALACHKHRLDDGNAYSELTLEDFRKVAGQLPEDADDGAWWYVNKWFFWNVMLPALWAETNGKPTVGTPEFFQDGPTKYFLGYPVEYVSAMPKAEANSQVCAILADLQLGAYLGERRVFTLEQCREVAFKTHQTAVKGSERIDINVFGTGDTTEAGPIVGLITAAS